MFCKKCRKINKIFGLIIIFAIQIYLLFPQQIFAATEEIVDKKSNQELLVVMQDLVDELRDAHILVGSDYDPVRTNFAAVMERTDVQQFFEAAKETSRNSGVVITRIDGLMKSVDGLSVRLEKQVEELAGLKSSDSEQGVDIVRNKETIRDIMYFLGWSIVIMISGAPAVHRFAHRHDGRKVNGEKNG